MKRIVAALAAALAIYAGGTVSAAEPPPTIVGLPEPSPLTWPCLAPGWTAGDRFGPGPEDIVPDVPPCPVAVEPAPSIEPLPDTDTLP